MFQGNGANLDTRQVFLILKIWWKIAPVRNNPATGKYSIIDLRQCKGSELSAL
jgi:hypothetical protein